MDSFEKSFFAVAGAEPYPWQTALHRRLLAHDPPTALDIPTGLGKTSAVLIYLLALAIDHRLPRRLVYVVDRRAIVDQTSSLIRHWVDRLADVPEIAGPLHGLAGLSAPRPVALGVLRGGLADDGEWRMDPSRPAVIVGTVDMVGSRILFSGYGDGMSRRAMHAGLLGHDAFVMLDEAHLSPGMAGFVQHVQRLQESAGGNFRCLTMSATGEATSAPLTLANEDLEQPDVRRRLHARKQLTLHPVEDNNTFVQRITDLALGFEPASVALFVKSPETAARVAERLRKALGKEGAGRVGLLTGTLRGYERQALVETDVWQRFQPGRARKQPTNSSFLVMTSAGEVGVDLDADHGVMDATTLSSIIQRVGRINRAGLGDAQIHLVHTASETQTVDPKTKKEKPPFAVAVARCLALLGDLSDLSPQTLRAMEPARMASTSLPVARPVPLHRETVESFSATSAEIPLPPVSLFLRGITIEEEEPDTFLVWRWEVEHLVGCGEAAAADALAFYRPSPSEIARVPSRFAERLLDEALKRREAPLPVIIREAGGRTLAFELAAGDTLPRLGYATVILPVDAGGLDPSGLPSQRAKDLVPDVGDDATRRRRWLREGATDPDPWPDAVRLTVPMPASDDADDEETRQLLVYEVRRVGSGVLDAEGEIARFAAADQTVTEHNDRVGETAELIARALGLDPDIVAAIATAGRLHDRGKVRRLWQLAAGFGSVPEPMAKSRQGTMNANRLGGFRHEFASLADIERDLPPDFGERDLVLHLVAAHHGRARPGFGNPAQWDPEIPDAANRKLAEDAAERFGRLQARFGPWRLAWLEALLKAADAHVSAGRDQQP